MFSIPVFLKKIFILALLTTVVNLGPHSALSQEKDQQEGQKTVNKSVQITEEILVIGKKPKEQPVATVTTVDAGQIELQKPRDLAEAVRFVPGGLVTFGNKEEYSLKLRGFDNKRIALLVDGVPVIDPYYGSFDLKTVSSAGVDSIQITKGPSSVLYGPNTLGGIVNVITRRPGPNPKLRLNASLGNRDTKSFGLDATYQKNRVGVVGEASYQDSDGFFYNNNGTKQARANSDFKRLNLNAKFYYRPSDRTEIMVNGGYYHSAYGMPPDLSSSKPRYWRFPDWDRYTLNAGALTSLGKGSTLRFRAFYVGYKNSLDWFKDSAMTIRTSRSAFDNSVCGFFGIGDFNLTEENALKASLYCQADHVKTQDDINLPWFKVDQKTFSAAVEDHFRLTEQWKVIGGLSFDVLDKSIGKTATRVNPLLGLKFSPTEALDLHLSFSNKSKFPSMRSLYSSSSGNPDLKSERAASWEIGATYNRGFFVAASVFANKIQGLIDNFRLPDGRRVYFNIGRARVNGAELQIQKNWNGATATVNYTFLDHKNISDRRPLDVLSKHNLNFNIDFEPLRDLHLSLFGIEASRSFWFDANAGKLLDIPSYFNLDASFSYSFGSVAPFLKISNIFNHYYYTEPGFPWRGRYFEIGITADIF